LLLLKERIFSGCDVGVQRITELPVDCCIFGGLVFVVTVVATSAVFLIFMHHVHVRVYAAVIALVGFTYLLGKHLRINALPALLSRSPKPLRWQPLFGKFSALGQKVFA